MNFNKQHLGICTNILFILSYARQKKNFTNLASVQLSDIPTLLIIFCIYHDHFPGFNLKKKKKIHQFLLKFLH